MGIKMPYCENCGKEVSSTGNFCTNCGSRQNFISQNPQNNQPQNVIAPQSPDSKPATFVPPPPDSQISAPTNSSSNVLPIPPPPPTQSKNEPVVGVIVLRKSKSLGRYDSYSGVLTNQRFIFAQLTSEMIKNAAMQAKNQAKAEGKGFFAQWSEQIQASYSFSRRYLTMEPAAILSETPGNFEINNSAISEIKVKLKDIGTPENDRHEFEIEIKSISGKYEFRMDENNQNTELLKQVYGQRVKMPFGYFNHNINIKIG